MDQLRYDPKRQGPLLFVAQYRRQLEYDLKDEQAVKGKTPTQFAVNTDRRIATVGGISALIPRTMKVIVKNPGKPDPDNSTGFKTSPASKSAFVQEPDPDAVPVRFATPGCDHVDA